MPLLCSTSALTNEMVEMSKSRWIGALESDSGSCDVLGDCVLGCACEGAVEGVGCVDLGGGALSFDGPNDDRMLAARSVMMLRGDRAVVECRLWIVGSKGGQRVDRATRTTRERVGLLVHLEGETRHDTQLRKRAAVRSRREGGGCRAGQRQATAAGNSGRQQQDGHRRTTSLVVVS